MARSYNKEGHQFGSMLISNIVSKWCARRFSNCRLFYFSCSSISL